MTKKTYERSPLKFSGILVGLILAVTNLIAQINSSSPLTNNHSTTYEVLKEGFNNPPVQARLKVYWWWLNGNTDTIRLREELLAMKKMGIGGVEIFEIGLIDKSSLIPAGPAFMSKGSLEAIKVAVKEATKLNIEVGLNVSSSWNAGGTWTLPEHAAKALYVSKTKVKGVSADHKISLPFPKIQKLDNNGKELILYGTNGKPVYYEDVAVLAIPLNQEKNTIDTTKIINLSGFFNAEKDLLDWKAPSGEWEIYRYVSSNSGEHLRLPSPNSDGPIVDHFDPDATRVHFMYIINQLQSVLGNLNETTLKSLYLASYESTGSTWTSSLPAEFKKVNGYDIHEFIPALYNEDLFSKATTERIRADFRRTLSELMINNLYKTAKEVTNQYGLKINCEAGGPGLPIHNVPVEPLKALGALDIPRGEFWNKHQRLNKDSIDILRVVKEVAAASHIYNRGIVEEESFTSFQHWQEGPFDLKPLADRAFCEGMNRVVVHGFTHNPGAIGFPGIGYHAGTHFNDKNGWWQKARPFVDYLTRLSYVFQKTNFIADVLYYYGDKIPNYVAPKNTRFTVGAGYDYEVINSEILIQLTVKNGQLALPNGSRFKLLVLGDMEAAPLEVFTKLRELSEQGAIITGAKPRVTPGIYNTPEKDKLIENLSNRLWVKTGGLFQKETLQKGKILSDVPPLKILQGLNIFPDFEYSKSDSGILDYIHAQRDNIDFYMVRNTTDKWVSKFCSFRQGDKLPEIWSPLSGDIIPISVYNQDKQQVKIPLTIPPYGSYLVVFRKQPSRTHYNEIIASGENSPPIEYTKSGLHFLQNGSYKLALPSGIKQVNNSIKTINIKGPWKVTFPKGWGAPDTATFPELISWSKSENQGIKYFSGTAAYSKTFHFSNAAAAGNKVYLDLGDISEVAEVWLNGKRLGITWAKPYSFDVSTIIKNGANILKIEVVNTWSNRITGDAITGEKYTETNINISSTKAIPGPDKVLWAQTPLLESGLSGPVTLQIVKLVIP